MEAFEVFFLAWIVLTVAYLAAECWHLFRCRSCRLARQALQAQHPDWWVSTCWLLSHRGRAGARAVIAVFYSRPNVLTRPEPYKLFAVSPDLSAVEELPADLGSQFRIRGRR